MRISFRIDEIEKKVPIWSDGSDTLLERVKIMCGRHVYGVYQRALQEETIAVAARLDGKLGVLPWRPQC